LAAAGKTCWKAIKRAVAHHYHWPASAITDGGRDGYIFDQEICFSGSEASTTANPCKEIFRVLGQANAHPEVNQEIVREIVVEPSV
jgi:hypothetical protein